MDDLVNRNAVTQREGWQTVSRTLIDPQKFVPIRDDYARISIREGFDWLGGVGDIPDFRAYLVVFRSVRKLDADVERLISHDDRAHDEAMISDGFLYYFKGDVAHDRYCLSFCLWKSRDHARAAAAGVYHQLAVAITEEMYETYDLERYHVYLSGGNVIFESADSVYAAPA